MRLFLSSFLLFPAICSFSQYYYKDIIGTKSTADLIKKYRALNINRAILSSYDGDNKKNEDFFATQEFSNNFLRTVTRSNITSESVLISYIDAKNNVVKTIDSSEEAKTETTYEYGNSGELISLDMRSSDSASATILFEKHWWRYKNSHPESMLKIKNTGDTSLIQFKVDEKGNVTEEQETYRGTKSEPIYYYYDSDNHLTDIVTYNKRAKRLLPEYMFEYDANNRIIQQITVPANSSDYLIWRYQYDEKGLKTKEAVYNKQKQLTGKIEYQYF